MAKKQKESKNLLEVQNAAKTMFANIRFQSIDNPIKTVLLTSSVPDEGKTTSAWYLAQAAATAGNRVLLIEADMRRRSLANMLQLHPQNGLFAVLSGNARLSEAMVPTSVKNLYFLDSEPSIPNPPDVLASKRMSRLNESLAQEFDYVFYDTPPVGTFVDAAVLSTIVDGVVLVVRPGRPKRTELQMAYTQLANADAHVIGLCATFVEGTGSEYYYSYYTKDHSKSVDVVVDAAPAQSTFAPVSINEAPAATSQRRASRSVPAKQVQGGAHSSAPASRDASGGARNQGISVPRTTPGGKAGASGAGNAGGDRQAYSASPDGTVQVPRH